MKTALLLTLICLGPAGAIAAPAPSELFEAANRLFEKGQIDRAKNRYIDLVEMGYAGPALAYNLGNAYYRLGRRGKAVLWYERAGLAAPRDADVSFNLSLARSHIKDTGMSIFRRAVLLFTPSELGAATAVLIWLFFGLLGCGLIGWIRFSPGLSTALTTLGLLLLLTGGVLGANFYLRNQPWAIVVQAPGEVRNGPGTDYAVGFTVPEGSRVLVLKQRPDWIQIGAPQEGLKGWISAEKVEAIRRIG